MNILEIEIATDNFIETELSYATILGLRTIKKEQSSISFLAGQSVLTFTKSEGGNPTYHFAFNIPHNKIDEAVSWTSARLDLIRINDLELVADFENWNAKAFYFYDNNNNILEFIARFEVENYSYNQFDASSIQSISEVGIVTDDPLTYADNLVKNDNVSYFHKQPKSENFVVLGNDEGLFIIAKTQRNWYPTNKSAGKYPLKIKFKTDNLVRELKVNGKSSSG